MTVKTKTEKRKPKTGPSAKPEIKDFKDLDAWKLACELRQRICRLAKSFPRDEQHGLTSQIRRAAVSVSANIAEGYGRYSYKENTQFCRHSRASVYEIRDHLTTALDEGYIGEKECGEADTLARRVIQILNGYIRSTQKLSKQGSGE